MHFITYIRQKAEMTLAQRILAYRYLSAYRRGRTLVFGYTAYSAEFLLCPRNMEVLKDYGRVVLQFADEDSRELFERFAADELTDPGIIEFVALQAARRDDDLEEFATGPGTFEIPVNYPELLKLIDYCDRELEEAE